MYDPLIKYMTTISSHLPKTNIEISTQNPARNLNVFPSSSKRGWIKIISKLRGGISSRYLKACTFNLMGQAA